MRSFDCLNGNSTCHPISWQSQEISLAPWAANRARFALANFRGDASTTRRDHWGFSARRVQYGGRQFQNGWIWMVYNGKSYFNDMDDGWWMMTRGTFMGILYILWEPLILHPPASSNSWNSISNAKLRGSPRISEAPDGVPVWTHLGGSGQLGISTASENGDEAGFQLYPTTHPIDVPNSTMAYHGYRRLCGNLAQQCGKKNSARQTWPSSQDIVSPSFFLSMPGQIVKPPSIL